MDVVKRCSLMALCGSCYAFGPAWTHAAILLLYPVAAGQRKKTPWIVLTFYALALTPAALAAYDYSQSLVWSVAAWGVPVLINLLCISTALRQKNSTTRIAMMCVALIALSVPPLAAVSMMSPIPIAGLLFPGTGWIGVASLFALIACLSVLPEWRGWKSLSFGLGLLMLSSHVTASANVVTQHDRHTTTVAGITTARGMPSATQQQAFAQAWRLDELELAESTSATTVIFPESTLGDWASEKAPLWNDTAKQIIAGARVSVNKHQYLNVLVSNRHGIVYQQRQPLPVSFGHTRQAVKGQGAPASNAALNVLLCIELANPWLALTTFSRADDFVVWAANLGWSTHPSLLRRAQTQLRHYAQLFGVTPISAVNNAVPAHG